MGRVEPPPSCNDLEVRPLALNVLVRGQSNALLFADRGGAAALERGLEARLGVDVHMLYGWGTDSSTIHSATAFMAWDTGGQRASLLRYLDGLPPGLKGNPTATVWMHNEYDQQDWTLTTEAWLGEVRADAEMVRGALGQGAATTPYTFVPVRYAYGPHFGTVSDGMGALDAAPAFNASVSWAAWPLAMDGDGHANSSHMGDGDAVALGGGLAAEMAETLRPLVGVGVSANLRAPAPAAATAEAVRFYETALDRPPDAAGLAHWAQARAQGATPGRMADALIGSAEFQARYGALSDQGFVERLYLNALDRPGEGEGIAYWASALEAGALSRAEVVAGIASSHEMAVRLTPYAADGIAFV